MRPTVILLAAVAQALLGSGAVAEDGPPLADGLFVDEGACPYEGCIYRDWTVKADTVLMSQPRGDQPVGSARTGKTVEAETGVVYTNPVVVQVVHEAEFEAYAVTDGERRVLALSPGQQIYVLTYQGEGYQLLWRESKFYSADTSKLWDHSILEDFAFTSCDKPKPDCWWKIASDNRVQKRIWWIKIALEDGTEGWTQEAENFGNKFLYAID